MRITRRKLLSGAAAGVAGAALPRATWAASDLALGEMRLTTLSDGYLTQPPAFRYGPMPREELAAYLASTGTDPNAPITPPCNITLLRHEDRVILFDAGAGLGFLPTVGALPDALAAVGIAPQDVTHVLFTHGHADHLWGVLDDLDDPLFANATHMMGRGEFDYWFDPETVTSIAEDRVPMAVGAKRRLDVLAERMALFDDGQEILPGIAARATPGHTAGHMSFELRAGNAGAMVVGDAILNEHFSVAHPDWHDGADTDRAQAAATRLALLDQLAHDQMPMIGFHMAGGGIGHVERSASGFGFIPAAT
ncbi:MAG TPA: MBL fold metallo-hydrolase [Rhodobacterales bacterium]|nr:MBL fold metallo-hydrolase [Rhodobacterales bacterium]